MTKPLQPTQSDLLWLSYNQWPACEATTWITYADEVVWYCESPGSRSWLNGIPEMTFSVTVWFSFHSPSACLTVTLHWFVKCTYCSSKWSQSRLCTNVTVESCALEVSWLLLADFLQLTFPISVSDYRFVVAACWTPFLPQHAAWTLVYAVDTTTSTDTSNRIMLWLLMRANTQTPQWEMVLSWTHYYQLTNCSPCVESLRRLAADATSQKVQILNLKFCRAEYIFVMAGKHWQICRVHLPIGCCCAKVRKVFQVM